VIIIIIIIIFKAHQHEAAGRKTRLDIQNYGCNSNLLCYHGIVLLLFLHFCMLFIIIFFDSGTQFSGNEKITLCNTEKYKNQAGMNLSLLLLHKTVMQ